MAESITPSSPLPEIVSTSTLRYSHGWTSDVWAMYWDTYGFGVVPHPQSSPDNFWPTHEVLSVEAIKPHWNENPDDGLAFFPGEDLVVFGANSPESVAALADIETRLGVSAKLIVKIGMSEHHYFLRDFDFDYEQFGKRDDRHPEHIDIITGQVAVRLPPTAGASVVASSGDDKEELSEAGPKFLTAILQHNESLLESSEAVDAVSSEDTTECVPPPVITESEAIEAGAQVTATSLNPPPLSKYSLRGYLEELEKQAVDQCFVLGSVALLGQSTVIYAKPNTGKTLITLHLLVDAIRQGKVNPSLLFYINMDDDSVGLHAKAKIAEEYGFHMLADGWQGFAAKSFPTAMKEMVESGSARNVIVILDTLKKFVNTMDKSESSNFAKMVRQFVIKGGTVIALSHANKHSGSDGKPIFSGTSDIVDDFDCAYTMSTIREDADNNERVVEFDSLKRRGCNAKSAGYSYALRSTSYGELLLSVQEVDQEQLLPIKEAAEDPVSPEVLSSIAACISRGVNTKMKLVHDVSVSTKVSRNTVTRAIDKYTGDDPRYHKWSFVVRERGAKVYVLLNRPPEPPPVPSLTPP